MPGSHLGVRSGDVRDGGGFDGHLRSLVLISFQVRGHAPHVNTCSRPPWRNPSGNGNCFPPFPRPPPPAPKPTHHLGLPWEGRKRMGGRERKKQGEKPLPALTREKTEIKTSKNKAKQTPRTRTEGRRAQCRGHTEARLSEAGLGGERALASDGRNQRAPSSPGPTPRLVSGQRRCWCYSSFSSSFFKPMISFDRSSQTPVWGCSQSPEPRAKQARGRTPHPGPLSVEGGTRGPDSARPASASLGCVVNAATTGGFPAALAVPRGLRG